MVVVVFFFPDLCLLDTNLVIFFFLLYSIKYYLVLVLNMKTICREDNDFFFLERG